MKKKGLSSAELTLRKNNGNGAEAAPMRLCGEYVAARDGEGGSHQGGASRFKEEGQDLGDPFSRVDVNVQKIFNE